MSLALDDLCGFRIKAETCHDQIVMQRTVPGWRYALGVGLSCRRSKRECLRYGLKCRLSDQCVAHALLRAAPTLMWALVPQMR